MRQLERGIQRCGEVVPRLKRKGGKDGRGWLIGGSRTKANERVREMYVAKRKSRGADHKIRKVDAGADTDGVRGKIHRERQATETLTNGSDANNDEGWRVIRTIGDCGW